MIQIRFNTQRRSGLVLGNLNPNDTFVMLDQEGETYEKVYRVLWENSNYLNHQPYTNRRYIIDLQSGKIHHRDLEIPVARIDIKMTATRKG